MGEKEQKVEYAIKEKCIYLTVAAGNAGKYRFKKRKDRFDFGETFSTRKEQFDEEVYLEWQISYDATVKDVKAGEAKTKLAKKDFIGSNGQRKYPRELSEYFYTAIKIGFITKKDAHELLEEIKGYKKFIDNTEISIERLSKVTINGVNFEETSIKLPTLFMVDTYDKCQIEVSTQKQQYATGVQPMVYYCIPINAFDNSNDVLGRASTKKDELTYIINNANAKNLILLMKIFGMASKRHNYDIIKILETLLEVIGR